MFVNDPIKLEIETLYDWMISDLGNEMCEFTSTHDKQFFVTNLNVPLNSVPVMVNDNWKR